MYVVLALFLVYIPRHSFYLHCLNRDSPNMISRLRDSHKKIRIVKLFDINIKQLKKLKKSLL